MPKITDPNSDKAVIGRKIKERREELGMTQAELADKINVEGNTVYRIEAGMGSTSVDKLCLIADALQTTPNELFPERFEKNEEANDQEKQLVALFSKLPSGCKDSMYQTMMNMMKGTMGMAMDA